MNFLLYIWWEYKIIYRTIFFFFVLNPHFLCLGQSYDGAYSNFLFTFRSEKRNIKNNQRISVFDKNSFSLRFFFCKFYKWSKLIYSTPFNLNICNTSFFDHDWKRWSSIKIHIHFFILRTIRSQIRTNIALLQ